MSRRLKESFVVLLGLAAMFGANPPIAASANAVAEFRAKLEKWVAVRQVLSEERSDWLVDKEYLNASRRLLEREKTAIQAEIAAFEKTDEGASEERRMLLIERGELQRTAISLEKLLTDLEGKILAIVPSLPEPLQDKLDSLLVQIPEDPDRAGVTIGQRIVNLLGILIQAEKFNSTATLVGETRAIGNGPKVQVRTLYWGLAQAVYVDSQGENAGIARPSSEGWEFVDDVELASDAKLLLDIYEGNVDTISFIPIPVSIQ